MHILKFLNVSNITTLISLQYSDNDTATRSESDCDNNFGSKGNQFLSRNTKNITQQRYEINPVFFGLNVVLLCLLVTILLKRFTLKKKYVELKTGQKNQLELNVAGDLCKSWKHNEITNCLEIPRKDFELSCHLGRGVHHGKLMDQLDVIVKVPVRRADEDTFQFILNEIKTLSVITKNPNILSLIGACTSKVNERVIYSVLEYCKHGNLLRYLHGCQFHSFAQEPSYGVRSTAQNIIKRELIDIKIMCRFCREIASGMQFLSENTIVHGNLSAQFVLLTADLTCKIGGFMISQQLKKEETYTKQEHEPLEWRWMAPEILKRMDCHLKSDVWSYGVTLWEIFSLGALPYGPTRLSPGLYMKLDNGFRIEKPKHATNNIYEKMLSCWSIVPEKRPSFHSLARFFEILQRNEYYDGIYEIIPINENETT